MKRRGVEEHGHNYLPAFRLSSCPHVAASATRGATCPPSLFLSWTFRRRQEWMFLDGEVTNEGGWGKWSKWRKEAMAGFQVESISPGGGVGASSSATTCTSLLIPFLGRRTPTNMWLSRGPRSPLWLRCLSFLCCRCDVLFMSLPTVEEGCWLR